MTSYRFMRTSLKATQHGIPEPQILVERWADDLECVLARWSSDPEPLDYYDLLAATGRLTRSRQDLVRDADAERELVQARNILEQHGPLVVERACSVPNVNGWMEHVAELESSFDEMIDPVARNLLAEQVLMDDAELVAYAARRQGLVDAELEQELLKARVRVLHDASLFLPAGVFVQAVGMTLRPQIEEEDYDLAATALKFEAILDAAEQAEAELKFVDAKLWVPGAVQALARKYRETVAGPRAVAVLPIVVQYRRWLGEPAAIAVAEAAALQPTTVRWDSPDGCWVAYLTLPPPPQPPAPQTVSLSFYTAAGDRAEALAGQPVWLDGVASQVDQRGRALFPRDALAAAGQHALRLEVGPQHDLWKRHAA